MKPTLKQAVKIIKKQEKALSRKSLIDKLDDVVSLLVRKLAHYRCIRYGKFHGPKSKNLTCTHYWSRVHMGTRWDLDNLDAACWFPCHKYKLEGEKQGWYRNFMINKLGQKGFDKLEMKANTITKFSSSDLLLLLRDFQQKLEAA